ncbi:MAG: metallophosphoesterase [Candidatus Saganbacteria bacterium]|nr:metallophosphoesterase [Candidatus Saganbacteria bacterium]
MGNIIATHDALAHRPLKGMGVYRHAITKARLAGAKYLEPLEVKYFQNIDRAISHLDRGYAHAVRLGALLMVDPTQNFVFVGDLHGNIENLEIVLDRYEGRRDIVLLGDAVHPKDPAMVGSMRSSVVIMDKIFQAIGRHPGHFYYLQGNHDCFADYFGEKDPEGTLVIQGVAHEDFLEQHLGRRYINKMDLFREGLPYAMKLGTALFVAHSAVVKDTPDYPFSDEEDIINACQDMASRRFNLETIRNQLRWNRPGEGPFRYKAADVVAMREIMGLDKNAIILSGHTEHPAETDSIYEPFPNHWTLQACYDYRDVPLKVVEYSAGKIEVVTIAGQ